MNKTLLLLDGQTVIVTGSGDDGLACGGLEGAHDLAEAGRVPDGKGGLVQLTVGGHDQGTVHKVVEQPLARGGAATKVVEGGFVPLPVVSLQGCVSVGQQQHQQVVANHGGVYSMTQLLPHSTDTKTNGSNVQQEEGSSRVGVGGLASLGDGGSESQASVGAKDQGQAQATLVAIIQGEDGSSQTVELSPEDACRLGLPQLLQDTAIQALPGPTGLAGERAQPALTKEDVPVVHKGQPGPGQGQETMGDEGEEVEVSDGPFLLLGECRSDGSVDAVLQICTSEAESMPGTARASIQAPDQSDAVLAGTSPRRMSLTQPGNTVQRHRLPVTPCPRRQSCYRAAAPEWPAVPVAQPGTRECASNSYFRDVAKRTKFRNLTALLDATATVPGRPDAQSVPGTTTTTNTTAPLHHHTTTSPSPPSPPQKSANTFTIRVNTGTIKASTSSTSTTTTSTSTPSIKCAELSEGVEGNSRLATDTASKTTYVYSSSGSSHTPVAVHLPSGDRTKPLGSSENPIQLVQQGNTFQALQPVQERQLEQITTLLQQRRITAPTTKNYDEIYDPKTNMKIVYRVVFPEDTHGEGEEDEEEEEEGVDVSCMRDEVWEEALSTPVGKRRGRRRKWRKASMEEPEVEENCVEEEEIDVHTPSLSRTRSGRISRPPRHMMKDFKHLFPGNSTTLAKDRKTGDQDCNEFVASEAEKEPSPMYSNLPRRKKRELNASLLLKYTCATCGKFYMGMGRIGAHYRKFPDHFHKPPSPEDPKQTYSTIRTLSESKSSDESINKSVLSPTPGTQASETTGEPGLPIETLTTQPQVMEDPLGMRLGSEEPQPPPVTAKKTRKRQKRFRTRGAPQRGRPPRAPSKEMPVTPCPRPIKVLEKLLNSYTSQDIQTAVGQRLFQNLSPWQLLCFQVDRAGTWPQWQERLRLLEDLLRECREEFHSQTEPLTRPSSSLDDDPGSPRLNIDVAEQDSGKGEELKDGMESSEGTDGDSSSVIKEENGSFEVSDYLANILGVMSREYQVKCPPSHPPSPLLQPPPTPPRDILPQDIHTPQVKLGKRLLEEEKSLESPPKKRDSSLEITVSQGMTQVTTTPLDTGGMGATMDTGVEKPDGNKYTLSMDGVIDTAPEKPSVSMDVTSALEDTCNLSLSAYTLPEQLGPVTSQATEPTSLLSASNGSTQLATTLSHLTSDCTVTNTTHTTHTTHPIPASLPMEIPSFSNSTSPPLPLNPIETFTSSIPQNTLQPLGDMDITAEDLPRLLSEGTGLVVGSTESCDAPKLLDTSGDTTDLSEMLFKLQEATAGITQTQDSNLGQQIYQEGVNTNPQLIPSHVTHPGVSLTQDFTVGSLNQHPDPNLSTQARQSTEPSMPLLTFSGALNSNFHSSSSLSQVIAHAEEANSADFHSTALRQVQEPNKIVNPDFHGNSALNQVTSQAQVPNKMEINSDFHSSSALSEVIGQPQESNKMQVNTDFHSNALSQVLGHGGKIMQLDPTFHSNTLSQVISRSEENKAMQLNSNFHGASEISHVVNPAGDNKINLHSDFHRPSEISHVVNPAGDNKIGLSSDFHRPSEISHVVNPAGDNKIGLSSDFHRPSEMSQVVNSSDKNKIQLNSTFHDPSKLSPIINPSSENKIQLDTNFHTTPGLSEIINSNEKDKLQLNPHYHAISHTSNKIEAILSEVRDHMDGTEPENTNKVGEGDINVDFGTENLTALEDLLKR